MTTKTRNEYIALVVVLLVLGYILYHYVFAGSSATVAPSSLNQSTSMGASAPGATSFLPNGSTLDATVLQSPTFNALLPLPTFSVNASEVGVANPFAAASTK